MTAVPKPTLIYHITHVDNLPKIAAGGDLISDAEMIRRGGPPQAIGMSKIKERRLTLPVSCHPGDYVGDYVPFYFCPRSIMLYVIHAANDPGLKYRGGQDPIVHLEADLASVAAWAKKTGRRWAFSLSNAGAVYTEFRSDLAQLTELDWSAIAALDWRATEVRSAKQAEFLVHGTFPWSLVSRIGVRTAATKKHVEAALGTSAHKPLVEVRPGWYY